MDNINKVSVVSTVNGQVGLVLPELHFKRDWPKKGAKVMVDKDILREAIYDPGTEYMFKSGMLYIDDLEFKKELGLEPEEATKPENVIVLTEAQMKRYLTVAPVRDLKEIIPKLSKEQLKNLVDYAVDNELTDIDKASVLKEASGIDIVSAVLLKRQNKEE